MEICITHFYIIMSAYITVFERWAFQADFILLLVHNIIISIFYAFLINKILTLSSLQ